MLEINPLAAGHQRQRRLAEEMEMPEIAQQKDVVPVADAGQERLHQHEPIDFGRVLRRIGIGDHQPDIVADQTDSVVFQAFHQRMDILRHRLLGVSILGRRRLTEAAQIRRDHSVFVGKLCDQRPPHVAGFGEAMQQHDRIAFAGDEVMQPDAVDLGEFALCVSACANEGPLAVMHAGSDRCAASSAPKVEHNFVDIAPAPAFGADRSLR